MGRLTRELLERYHDGELSAKARKRVEALLAESPEARASLDQLEKLGNLLRVMNEHSVSSVSFDGFEKRVINGLEQERRPGLGERLRVWAGEFFEHRKVVWIPSAAVVAVAATVVLVFAFVSSPQTPPGGMHPAAPQVAIGGGEADGLKVYGAQEQGGGSEIVSVNFGGANGFTTTVQNDSGEALGVVWINE
jgi:anti-sigma factor RsiW